MPESESDSPRLIPNLLMKRLGSSPLSLVSLELRALQCVAVGREIKIIWLGPAANCGPLIRGFVNYPLIKWS